MLNTSWQRKDSAKRRKHVSEAGPGGDVSSRPLRRRMDVAGLFTDSEPLESYHECLHSEHLVSQSEQLVVIKLLSMPNFSCIGELLCNYWIIQNWQPQPTWLSNGLSGKCSSPGSTRGL